MSSFKRRVNPSSSNSNAPLPAGVKPSSFSSPVPLVSTGVPALDDLLSGGGLSSGSSLLILPASGTAAQSAAQIGSSSSTPSATAETDHAARTAAEPYVELLLGYSVAQGIASGHYGVILGEDVGGLVGGLMARAGGSDDQLLAQLGAAKQQQGEAAEGPSEHLNTVNDEDEQEAKGAEAAARENKAQREREMKIAWRYQNMKQFNTTVNEASSGNEPAPFCQTFDLSKRMDGRILQHAVDSGKLETVDTSEAGEENAYEVAYSRITAAAERCRKMQQPGAAPPVLRIAIRALGSSVWTVSPGQTAHSEVIRFLNRLKRLLRSLSLVDSTSRTAAIPAIATISISSFLLTPLTAAHPSVNLAHRMVHSVDAAVSLSAFASSPALRSAFSAYTGAFKVLKTPAVGTLTNPSIRSSVLRGMGTGAGVGGAKSGGTGGGGEGGAGGGENNLAFKVRRKRLVIETLHLDVEGGVSERRTKPPKNMDASLAPKSGASTTSASSATGEESKSEKVKPAGPSCVKRQPAAAAQEVPAGSGARPKFGGLASLRQRGLAAKAAAEGSGSAVSQKEYAVEVDTDTHNHAHSHSHGQLQRRQPTNRVANTRAEDLEF
ncbi:hypothetical protein NDA11_002781 [Ustilago hordei]|uniref:Elongator complex protein 4 n=1 Tax=Ustilago hordei TaxID=120017 RepID=I2FWC1_USTHO|nr:uncharacterized protein UHO2_00641 [Ustilago hordei]KAJ1042214.1 hypothetical protein NDA10_007845 [Ustilago hordei]KAJ1587202.1 hypothetical protein NDA15_003107 [Ustilago hordei]KAJ1590196.1 hypothetical protein NDA12_005003 [Ustilago hordei]KAJ1594220.1 hypothetical protein NDA11_002781 [Ustilago hordei]KAJ1602506.1 hypothetical protein NDA14_006079 [Ustilago hordei]